MKSDEKGNAFTQTAGGQVVHWSQSFPSAIFGTIMLLAALIGVFAITGVMRFRKHARPEPAALRQVFEDLVIHK